MHSKSITIFKHLFTTIASSHLNLQKEIHGLASLAVPNTLESLPWISLTWVLQEPLLHTWVTYRSSLIYPLKTTIFMALCPTSWLLCVDWKLSALDRTHFLECYHHGYGSSLNFESCMLVATGLMVPSPQYLCPTYRHCK